MQPFRSLLTALGLAPRGLARVESIHFESLTERTLVLSPGTPVEAPGVVYLAAVHAPTGRTVGRWFRVAGAAAEPRYDERSRRQRGRVYVSIPVKPGDWLADQLALRSRVGDLVACTTGAPHGALAPALRR